MKNLFILLLLNSILTTSLSSQFSWDFFNNIERYSYSNIVNVDGFDFISGGIDTSDEPHEGYITSLTAFGEVIFDLPLGGYGISECKYLLPVDNGVLAICLSQGTIFTYELILLKISYEGDVIWTQNLGLVSDAYFDGKQLADKLSDNTIVILSTEKKDSGNELVLHNLTQEGEIINKINFDYNDSLSPNDIVVDVVDNIYITGTKKNINGIHVQKFMPNGVIAWTKSFHSESSNAIGKCLDIDNLGNLTVLGTDIINETQIRNLIFIQLFPNGDTKFHETDNVSEGILPESMVIKDDKTFLITGSKNNVGFVYARLNELGGVKFESTLSSFGDSESGYGILRAYDSEIVVNGVDVYHYIRKFTEEDLVSNLNDKIIKPSSIIVYPNPASNVINIAINDISQKLISVHLFNSIGEEVTYTSWSHRNNKLYLNKEISSGNYVLRLNFENKYVTKNVSIFN